MTLAELRTLYERATPGPWTWEDWTEDDGPNKHTLQGIKPFADDFERRLWEQTSPSGRPLRIVDREDSENPADGDFIVAARTWLPALVEVAEAAKDHRTDACDVPHEALDAALARLDEMERT